MPKIRKPMPADFPLFASREGNLRLRKRFKVGGITIEIWRRQLGVRYNAMPKAVKRAAVRRKAAKPARWQCEAIEDLQDFGGYSLARELGVCGGADDEY